MAFEIICGDVTELNVDAIVNAVNSPSVIGYGDIYQKAGPQLLKAIKKIGPIPVGQAAITRGFDLPAKYVIHAAGPMWMGGSKGEETMLRQTYDRALALAAKKRCKSVAFPLLPPGNCGFPKGAALQAAVSAFSAFLADHEMRIVLAVFDRAAFELPGRLFHSVRSYIDKNYIRSRLHSEYGLTDAAFSAASLPRRPTERRRPVNSPKPDHTDHSAVAPLMAAKPPAARKNIASPFFEPTTQKDMVINAAESTAPAAAPAQPSLEELLKKTDAGFSETLLKLIDRTGKKDSEIYKKANIDRKLFSKIRSNPAYKPSKYTAVAFAIALELDLDETRDFIGRAGFALTHSSKFDIIVEYFILHGNYNVLELNEMLFAFDQPLIGT